MPIIKTKQVFSGGFSVPQKRKKIMSKRGYQRYRKNDKVSTPQWKRRGLEV